MKFWATFVLLVSFGLNGSSHLSARQQVVVPAKQEHQRSAVHQQALDWKAKTLQQLQQELEANKISPTVRLELLARQQWLSKWTPGSMPDQPATEPESKLPEKRSEPNWESTYLASFQQLSKTDGVDFQDETEAVETEARLKKTYQRLARLVTKHPTDLGLQQALIHWCDNDSQRRKLFLDEIEAHVVQMAKQLETLLKSSPRESQRLKVVYEFLLYRHVRSLAYRELPDVIAKHPIEDRKQHDQSLDRAFGKLIDVAGSGHPEFVLIEIRMHRRAKQFGRALSQLERYGSKISPRWYLKKRRDLLNELNWTFPGQGAAEIYARKFPDAGD